MKTFRITLVLVAVFALSTPVVAQEPTPEQQAMMEMMEKLATPGEMHGKLEPMVGTFDVEATFWMAPGTEPMSSKGKSRNEWILGGRYVAQNYEGAFMGQSFNGLGMTGYDNYKKQYFGTWIDSMSTTMMMTTGQLEGNTFTFTGKMDEPMSGAVMDVTEKIVVHDDDHHVLEMWMPGPDGKMFKNMEIHYRRVK
jgi:hypothetical protein